MSRIMSQLFTLTALALTVAMISSCALPTVTPNPNTAPTDIGGSAYTRGSVAAH